MIVELHNDDTQYGRIAVCTKSRLEEKLWHVLSSVQNVTIESSEEKSKNATEKNNFADHTHRQLFSNLLQNKMDCTKSLLII